jgi:hypothetical protein
MSEEYLDVIRAAKESSNRNEKLGLFVQAMDTDKSRLEAYYELMMFYHDEKNYLLAAGYSLMAPADRSKASDRVYNYLFDMYKGVVCYWAGYYEEGYKATLKALENVSKETNIEIQTALTDRLNQNLAFFLPKLNKKVENKCEVASQTLIVIDNFYDDPDSMRSKALSMEFPVKGNYPGFRTDSFQPSGIKEKFEGIIGRPITYFPQGYNGSFQYTTEDMKSWIHRDLTDWSAVVFLTPNAPADGGTVLYRHKKSGMERAANEKDEAFLNESARSPEDWEVVDRIGNKYNRCVLFRGKNSHMSDRYFGNSKESGRLFQTFFFNDS